LTISLPTPRPVAPPAYKMGDEVATRKAFIQSHATTATLDI